MLHAFQEDKFLKYAICVIKILGSLHEIPFAKLKIIIEIKNTNNPIHCYHLIELLFLLTIKNKYSLLFVSLFFGQLVSYVRINLISLGRVIFRIFFCKAGYEDQQDLQKNWELIFNSRDTKRIRQIFLETYTNLFTKTTTMLTLLAKILNPADKEYTPSKASQKDEQVYKALIGDIGGTNIRLRLISFTKTSRVPKVIKASENMKSASFNSFADSISHFLKNVADNDWP